MEGRSYTIGEFARLLGVSPRTIDFYTRQGLLHPEQPSRGHGYRHYNEGDRARVALIKQLKARKFSLQEIRRVLYSQSGQKATSAVEIMEQVTLDLDRLQNLIQKTRSSTFTADQPAMPLSLPKLYKRLQAYARCSRLFYKICRFYSGPNEEEKTCQAILSKPLSCSPD